MESGLPHKQICLSDIAEEPVLSDAFALFLEQQRSVENFNFWKEVEKFHRHCKPQLTNHDENSNQLNSNADDKNTNENTNESNATHKKEILTKAKEIFQNFFIRELINVNEQMKSELQQRISSGNVSYDMFDGTQQEIYVLLSLDSFQRFISGHHFKDALLLYLQQNLKQPDIGIPLNPRRFRNKTLTNCFSGKEAVDWAINLQRRFCVDITRNEVTGMLQNLFSKGEFKLVNWRLRSSFVDSENCFYTFKSSKFMKKASHRHTYLS